MFYEAEEKKEKSINSLRL